MASENTPFNYPAGTSPEQYTYPAPTGTGTSDLEQTFPQGDGNSAAQYSSPPVVGVESSPRAR